MVGWRGRKGGRVGFDGGEGRKGTGEGMRRKGEAMRDGPEEEHVECE